MAAVENLGDLLGKAQFVIPLDRLAHQRGLVPHFLPPADRHGARTEPALLDRRRAPRHQHHRHMVGGGIERANRAVRQPDIGVQHHGLGPAGQEVIAVRHAKRGMFMRNGDGLRQGDAGCGSLCKSLDDRRKIGSGVGKDIVHAERLQAAEDHTAGAHFTGFGIPSIQVSTLPSRLDISIIEIQISITITFLSKAVKGGRLMRITNE